MYQNYTLRCVNLTFNIVRYAELQTVLKQVYNKVKLDDFEFLGKLGEGGFGLVVHCKKTSTNRHYAMKIQTKKGLLECFADDPWRVGYEKNAFASCQHPFIVNLDYAFQNETLVIMVLGLATAGDLQFAINLSPEERLTEERTQFYVAEIILALAHLHAMGLMYRDLKPNNVLLCADGHIQLVDMGGVVDHDGKTLGIKNQELSMYPLFSRTFGPSTTEDPSAGATPAATNKRRMSIMGTFGYMAPGIYSIVYLPIRYFMCPNVLGSGRDGNYDESEPRREEWIYERGGLVEFGSNDVQAADRREALRQ